MDRLSSELSRAKQHEGAGFQRLYAVGLRELFQLGILSAWVKYDSFGVKREDIVVVFFLVCGIEV